MEHADGKGDAVVTVLQKYCLTHDGYYREPRCWNGCELLVSWSEPARDVERESQRAMQAESADRCREASRLYDASAELREARAALIGEDKA